MLVVFSDILAFPVHKSKVLFIYLFVFIFVFSDILDIPVHKSKVHSLHVLFTLFSEFKNSQVCFQLPILITEPYQSLSRKD